jgi:hypothetical protein
LAEIGGEMELEIDFEISVDRMSARNVFDFILSSQIGTSTMDEYVALFRGRNGVITTRWFERKFKMLKDVMIALCHPRPRY